MLKHLTNTRKLTSFASFFSTQTFKPYAKGRDQIIRGFTKNGQIRFSFVDCSTSTQTSINNFNLKDEELYSPLANSFAFSLLLSSFLEGEERVKTILAYPSNQHAITVYAESMATGEIRGFARKEDKNQQKAQEALLSVSRVLYGQTSEFSTMIHLNPEFDGSASQFNDTVHRYFETSEQIPTFGNFFFDKKDGEIKSLNYLIQSLPGCEENYIKDIYQSVFEKEIWPQVLENKNLDATTLSELFHKNNLDVELKRYPADFYCRCKKDDFLDVLRTIDATVIFDMKEKNENELHCLYCNKAHFLEKEDFDSLLKEKSESQKIEAKE